MNVDEMKSGEESWAIDVYGFDKWMEKNYPEEFDDETHRYPIWVLQRVWNAAKSERLIPEELLSFVKDVSKQKPEKPDYWSSCSLCEHNQSEAEDLLEALSLK